MVRLFSFAVLLAAALTAGASAQERVQTPRQAAPAAQFGVQAQTAVDRRSVQCEVERLWSAHNGLLIDCKAPSGEDFYMAYDGGSLPGGIAAAMTLVTYAAGEGRAIRIDYELDPQNPICATVQAAPPAPCGRVITVSAFTN